MLPVVGECDDGDMADSRTVTAATSSGRSRGSATRSPEGSVGAGTGMTCFGFPGGIGTASRSVGDHHVGVLLLCNFGDREYLDLLEPGSSRSRSRRAPARLLHRGLRDRRAASALAAATPRAAPAARAGARGLLRGARARARSGWPFTASAGTRADERLDACFAAAYEAAREAVYNCLVAARPARRLDGSMQDAFPVDAVRRLARADA